VNTKEAWWAGFRAALNLPDSTTREGAMRIKDQLIGSRQLMDQEAQNIATAAIARAILTIKGETKCMNGFGNTSTPQPACGGPDDTMKRAGMSAAHLARDASTEAGSYLDLTSSHLQPAPAAEKELTDKEVDRILSTPIPGGSVARDWFLPHEQARGLANVRNVVRRMLDAAARPSAPLSEPTAEGALATLIAHAEGREPHAGAGMCPDSVEGHETRDSECSVCRALAALSAPASSAGMDAQRLDWIEQTQCDVEPHYDQPLNAVQQEYRITVRDGGARGKVICTASALTIREAIDAAMAATPPTDAAIASKEQP